MRQKPINRTNDRVLRLQHRLRDPASGRSTHWDQLITASKASTTPQITTLSDHGYTVNACVDYIRDIVTRT
jgi:hypothetical protein